MDNNPERFSALWPGGESAVTPITPAHRPTTLAGKRVAFVWDYVFRGEEIFPVIESALRERFPHMSFVGYDAFGSTFGGDEHEVLARLPARLHELGVDAVVSGIGA
jgi:hypothetical protein